MPVPNQTELILKWNWKIDNVLVSAVPSPSMNLNAGKHHAALTTETNFGCRSVEVDSVLAIFAEPRIKLDINASCVNRTIEYHVADLNNSMGNWYWDFGTGLHTDGSFISGSYSTKGSRPFTVIAESIKGCKDTLIRSFAIYDNIARAGKDTIVAKGEPVQLNAHGYPNSFYKWSPSTGLNDADLENPVATLDRDQVYQLDVWTKEGCDSHSQIFIKRYAGAELYIPNAFSPNGDRRNDVLKVFPQE